VFQTRYLLRLHRDRHLGLKPHLCTLCGKYFTSVSNLRKHQRTHTDPNAPPPPLDHKCEWCGKGFARHDLLKVRQLCSVRKIFTSVSNLRKHQQTHTDPNAPPPPLDHKCKWCGKGFARHDLLKVRQMCCVWEVLYLCEQPAEASANPHRFQRAPSSPGSQVRVMREGFRPP
jgi:uncharacterized Zn-finger protein